MRVQGLIASILISGLLPASMFPHASSLGRLLTALQAKYVRMRSLAADFVHVYHAAGSPTRREEGTVLLAKPRRMRWHYRRPEEKIFVSDGTHVSLYVPAERQVIRAKIREAEDIKASFAFFLGELDLQRVFTRIEQVAHPAPLHAGNIVLRFIPKDARFGFSEVIAEINPVSLHIVRVLIRELDGARSDFLFSNIRENVAVSRSDFVLSLPPGVHVLQAQ